ncbi:MAG: rod shape-determining protein MreC [Caldilineales bacterium]|nr:rod shape-determining protein MreC [Caldilineales bacterium]MCX7851238.1 rod shape-determining protein MreC [Caldilineales bacterium]
MRNPRLRPFLPFLLVVGAFVLMVLDATGALTPVESIFQTALRPVSVALTEARLAVSGLTQTARDLQTLRQRNRELEALVERLTVENLQLSEMATENATLRAFFRFAQANPAFDLRGGQVIARALGVGASPYVQVVSIDLGSRHGLRQGMPVVTDRGLVGRVTQVFAVSAEVLLLTDPTSAVNVMTQASRAPGMLRGRVGQLPIMDFIPMTAEIAIGEIVMTSGLGGGFPKGIIVGQVVEVLRNDNQAFQQAVVQPTVDFDRLELVLVMTNFPPEGEVVSPEGEGSPVPETTPSAP